MNNIIPVILSGGSGTRLWPYSRSMYPKQFLPLVNDQTLLQNTISRLPEGFPAPIVVCNEQHRFLVAEQLRAIDVQSQGILLEPTGRNTAPAIASAALHAMQLEDDPLIMVLPADHVIENIKAFHGAILDAITVAQEGKLVTFGVVPTYAETGYGYIQAEGQGTIRSVSNFLEKPDKENAEKYAASGKHFWNSGMFVFKASTLLNNLTKFKPSIVKQCRSAYGKAEPDLDFIRLDEAAFEKCISDSIDYAIMEPASKLNEVAVVPLEAGWSDVGSWSSLWDVLEKDSEGNSVRGDVLLHDTHNSYIQGEGKLIAAVGVRDTIIVQTDDAVMVAVKDKAQEIKQIVESLKVSKRPEKDLHRKVYRPWGYYDLIDSGKQFQVKRLVVKPGAKLSLQMHNHRAEHWVVVKGVAEIINGDQEIKLNENESTYIPIGVKHSLANPGSSMLEIIEVQSGSYLGEDDIIRFEDKYGRH